MIISPVLTNILYQFGMSWEKATGRNYRHRQ